MLDFFILLSIRLRHELFLVLLLLQLLLFGMFYSANLLTVKANDFMIFHRLLFFSFFRFNIHKFFDIFLNKLLILRRNKLIALWVWLNKPNHSLITLRGKLLIKCFFIFQLKQLTPVLVWVGFVIVNDILLYVVSKIG